MQTTTTIRRGVNRNVARNVWKILKAAAPRKNILPLNWLSFCWKFVFRFLCIFLLSSSLLCAFALTLLFFSCARLIYYSARQKKIVFFNKRSANLYDGNREHFYGLIFILTTSIHSTFAPLLFLPFLFYSRRLEKLFLFLRFLILFYVSELSTFHLFIIIIISSPPRKSIRKWKLFI